MATQLTKNFTLEELTKSTMAKKYKIDNKPDKNSILNLEKLAKTILQPIRDKFNAPIYVTSGYRSLLLNKKVGGSPTSQHLRGEAADLKTKSDSIDDNRALFNLIKRMIEEGKLTVGQLIDEYSYDWIHVSLPTNRHKNEVLHIRK